MNQCRKQVFVVYFYYTYFFHIIEHFFKALENLFIKLLDYSLPKSNRSICKNLLKIIVNSIQNPSPLKTHNYFNMGSLS